jgi:hypothetical protein
MPFTVKSILADFLFGIIFTCLFCESAKKMDDAWSSSKRAPVWTGGEGGGAEAFAQAVSEMVNHKQVYDMLETQSQVYAPISNVTQKE